MKNTEERHRKLARLISKRRIAPSASAAFKRNRIFQSGREPSLFTLGSKVKRKPGQRLIKLVKGPIRLTNPSRKMMAGNTPLSDAERVMKRLLESIKKNEPRQKQKLTQFSNKKKKSPGIGQRRLIDLIFQSPPENQNTVHSYEDFKRVLKARVDRINNFVRNYSLDTGLEYTIDEKYLESYYDKMEEFAVEHQLEKHKEEFLWHIAQLYPALTESKDPGKNKPGRNTTKRNVMRRISTSQDKRIREIKNRIEYLITAGIITEDISATNLPFWNEVLIEINHWQKAFAKKGKLYFFQPQLFYFVKFLNKIKVQEAKGEFFYSLFNEFELLEDIYSTVYSNNDLSPQQKQEDIEGKLANSISNIKLTKHVKMLMKYTR